jgi:hypothetical protein
MALLQIIYTSHATVRLDNEALQQLVARASRRNRSHSVTGMLYCAADAYLQVLEGDERDVIPIYANILVDDRHNDIRTVVIRPIEKRDFANWSMGLIEELRDPVDFAHVLARLDDRVGVWNDAAWQKILNTFRAELVSIEP